MANSPNSRRKGVHQRKKPAELTHPDAQERATFCFGAKNAE
jgi:hypothetical protein